MPSKPKVSPKTAGKTKPAAAPPPINEDNNEAAQQFETELCWCIRQLQIALKSGKLKPSQVQDHTKALNTLTSNTAPLPKKRQVMRMSFGDYRAKITEEDNKFKSVAANAKVNPVASPKSSVFFKKSSSVQSNEKEFKFNFAVPERSAQDDVAMVVEKDDTSMNDSAVNSSFKIVPSDNKFRFNFSSGDANDSVTNTSLIS